MSLTHLKPLPPNSAKQILSKDLHVMISFKLKILILALVTQREENKLSSNVSYKLCRIRCYSRSDN